jgi:hypothetical protein
MIDATLLRAKELKELLTDFVFDAEGELAIALETYSAEQMSRAKQSEMNQKNLLVDRFIVEGKINEKSPIDLFLEEEKDLSDRDRQLLKSWQRSFVGIFAIVEIIADGFKLMNWTTAKHYLVKPNNLPTLESMKRYKIGEILLAQIAPINENEWMFSSACTTLGKLGKPKLAVAIGNFKKSYPNYLYSDAPELLEQAWKSVEQYNEEFLEFFGSDRLTLSGYELNKKLSQFQEKTTQKRLDSAGIDRTKSIEELAENAGLSPEELESLQSAIEEEKKVRASNSNKMVQPQIELPAQLKKAEQVTVITHPRWGQMFLPTYQKLQDLLQSEDYKDSPDVHKLIRHYLDSPEINSFIWRDLANNYPQQLEAVLTKVLERPNFKLERDFNRLMQEYNKPLEPELPEIASVPLHIHTLFQDAVIEVQKTKSKDKANQKKAGKGFQK